MKLKWLACLLMLSTHTLAIDSPDISKCWFLTGANNPGVLGVGDIESGMFTGHATKFSGPLRGNGYAFARLFEWTTGEATLWYTAGNDPNFYHDPSITLTYIRDTADPRFIYHLKNVSAPSAISCF